MFKTATLALAAIAASATIASADFSDISNFVMEQDRDTQVELGTVRAAGDGVIEIYTYNKGEIGRLMGAEEVRAGANADVRVDISYPGVDAIALLKVNGQVVDSQELDFN